MILTTDETGHADSTAALGRFVDGFAAAAGGVGNIIDRRGALAAGTLTDDDFADADVVAIASGYEAISAADSARIINLMNTRPDLTFLIFSDGCCAQATNAARFFNAIRSATGWSALSAAYLHGIADFKLNASSPYKSSFTGLPAMRGGWYYNISNTPAPYALYLHPSVSATPR